MKTVRCAILKCDRCGKECEEKSVYGRDPGFPRGTWGWAQLKMEQEQHDKVAASVNKRMESPVDLCPMCADEVWSFLHIANNTIGQERSSHDRC